MVPDSPTQGDPQILSLMQGLVASEGTKGDPGFEGDYTKTGQPTAAGIGSWSNQMNGIPVPIKKGEVPSIFQEQAKSLGLDPNDFSKGNQNKVLYGILAKDKANKLSPEQSLSKWNSGNPNAYLTNPVEGSSVSPTGKTSVADYVKKGVTAAQAFAQSQKSNQGQVLGESTSNQEGSLPVTQLDPQFFQNVNKNAPKPSLNDITKGAEGLLTSIEKPFIGAAAAPTQGLAALSDKILGTHIGDPFSGGFPGAPGQGNVPVSPLNAEAKSGDVAQVASYFVPGSEGIPGVLGAAGMGALQGAGSAASAQENLPQVATSGLIGGALGAGSAAVPGIVGAGLQKGGDILSGDATTKTLASLKNAYASSLNLSAGERGIEARTGKDLSQVLMDHSASLGRYDDGTLDATEALHILSNKQTPLDAEVQVILNNADKKATVNLLDVAKDAKNGFESQSLPALDKTDSASKVDRYMEAEINSRINKISQDTYQQSFGNLSKQQQAKVTFDAVNVPVADADKIKTGFWNAVGKGFDRDTKLGDNATYQLGSSLKSKIEEAVPDDLLAQVNKERGELIDAQRRLMKLDGVRRVRGGSLGNIAGGLKGTIAGMASGGGLPGALAGDYFGTKASEFMNNPATRIAIGRGKVKASGLLPGILGRTAKPIGRSINALGRGTSKLARPAGLVSNVIAGQ